MEQNIKRVAIYLRKSRTDDDTEDVLVKHRERLIEFCNRYKYVYEIFEEPIMSGERLKERPVINNLLNNIYAYPDKYSGIVVVHYDRLSRGWPADFDRICKILMITNTYLITPEKIYDLNVESDRMTLNIQSVFSNTELNTIKKRMFTGKIMGFKQGRLSNGNPPYPYEKNLTIVSTAGGKRKIDFDIIVNPDKKVIYDRILDMYINKGYGTEKISFILNADNIPAPSGKSNIKWSATAVQRTLKDEFHLGKLFFMRNKYYLSPISDKKEVRPRDETEWIVGESIYEKIKTQEQHDKIIEIMNRNNKVPKRARHGDYPTSGLLICKKCGRVMTYSVGKYEVKKQRTYDYAKCVTHSPTGDKCPQKGVKMDEDFYNALYTAIINSKIDKTRMMNAKLNRDEQKQKSDLIKQKQKQYEVHQKALLRAKNYTKILFTLTKIF